MDWQPQASDQDLRTDPMLRDVPEIEGFKVLEPCVLYARLGQGGMGTVYRGRHLNLEIDVAVKCLNKALALQGSGFVERFQREARLAASIHHQNLVQVYDVSQRSGVHYLVMEFVTGETARDRVGRKGPLSAHEALKIIFGAASGLSEAHAKKIVHRDIKPDNILISHDGRVKVADLGLAKALEVSEGQTLTQGVMGTPQYMAPEQWEDSSRVGPMVDVWALGATLYFLLAGENAIPSGSMQQVCRRICVDAFPDVRAKAPRTPGEVVALIERCVDRDPARRIADCRELNRVLQPLLGVDAGSLADPMSGTTRIKRTLLSPPPPHTLARIRVAVDTKKITDDATLLHGDTPAGPPGPARGAPWAMGGPRAPIATPVGGEPTIPAVTPVPAPAAPAPPPEKKRLPAVQIALGVVLVGVLGGWALREYLRDSKVEAKDQTTTSTASLLDTGAEQTTPPVLGSDEATTELEPEPPVSPRQEPPAVVEEDRRSEPAPIEEEPTALVVAPPPVVEPPPPPVALSITAAPATGEPLYASDARLTLHGSVTHRRAGTLSFELAGEADETLADTAQVLEDGSFELTLALDREGAYELIVSTEGLERPTRLAIVRDSTPPSFVSVGPESEAPIGTRIVSIAAVVEDSNPEKVLVDGRPMTQDSPAGSWKLAGFALQEGLNQIQLHAIDLAGNTRDHELSLKLDTIQPGLRGQSPAGLDVLNAGKDYELSLDFSEAVASAQIRTKPDSSFQDLSVDGLRATGPLRTPDEGTSLTVEWQATDLAGNATSGTLTYVVDPSPVVPPGCMALDTTYGIGRWAKRVKHEQSGIVLLLIEPGRFQMGGSGPAALADEKPVHEVVVSSPFYLAETETTQAQWRSVMQDRRFEPGEDNLPAAGISWHEAMRFCERADLRLPSEAEWEYACRAGTTKAYSGGDKLAADAARFTVTSTQLSRPVAAGSFSPNAWGLRDMHGNVWEWCADVYDPNWYEHQHATVEDHLRQGQGPRVRRGGSFASGSQAGRSSARNSADPARTPSDTGFRVALEAR